MELFLKLFSVCLLTRRTISWVDAFLVVVVVESVMVLESLTSLFGQLGTEPI